MDAKEYLSLYDDKKMFTKNHVIDLMEMYHQGKTDSEARKRHVEQIKDLKRK